MTIYEVQGVKRPILNEYKGNLTPFDYIAKIKPMKPPENMTIDEFKQSHAPYCIAGKVKPDKNGIYKRSNATLIYRDLVFIDYDDITISPETFKDTVHSVLSDYSYILYPTIKHTPEKPRYRLVVKPDKNLTEPDYKATVNQIANLIGLPYDQTSITWSQLQGLPVTRLEVDQYDRVVNLGTDFPTIRGQTVTTQATSSNFTLPSGQLSITMKVINTLFHGYGTEGGRNVAMTKFVGLLLNKYVNCDIETAYDLALIANENTDPPLTINELDTTFRSILQAEMRKRGKQL
ncbi:primase alpha helix C-terminal domain-containing protein [Streptococcus uberis]|uniref:primase alpha helix C-terminal domain-containing protein n=1 Tax=Streptococcus uberis TaxID=1349 RepID=UPI00193A926B|nr:primase alpha helix C-terminal domain-containing protein [Streptococcus uberis]